MNVARAAGHVCRPIRSNGAFGNDRLRQGGGPYAPRAMANAIDLACPG